MYFRFQAGTRERQFQIKLYILSSLLLCEIDATISDFLAWFGSVLFSDRFIGQKEFSILTN
jgi:hypothetical protein